MGKINMGIFYGKKYNSGNRTFSLENGENFIEGTGPDTFAVYSPILKIQ